MLARCAEAMLVEGRKDEEGEEEVEEKREMEDGYACREEETSVLQNLLQWAQIGVEDGKRA